MMYKAKSGLKTILLSLFLFSIFCACSLNYGQRDFTEEGIPELIFFETEYMKFEKSKRTTALQGKILEFYGKESLVFGKEIQFQLYNPDQTPSAEGKTSLLYADQAKEIYSLLNFADVTSYNQNMKVNAKNLRWNNKNEQLVAAKEDEVSIEYGSLKNDGTAQLQVSGKQFSASGIGLEYRFGAEPKGTILTDEDIKKTLDIEENADTIDMIVESDNEIQMLEEKNEFQ